MSYDEWKQDEHFGKSSKDLRIEELEAQIIDMQDENKHLNERVKLLTDTLEEILENCREEYDVEDDATGYGDVHPNRWMRLGSMIEETLYGPGVHW